MTTEHGQVVGRSEGGKLVCEELEEDQDAVGVADELQEVRILEES